jgi:hypothetical protein
MMIVLVMTATCLAWGAVAPAADAAGSETPAAPARLEVKASTMPTVGKIYTADKVRDPFARWGAGHGPTRPFTMEDFSIHKLSLRGIMKDAVSEFALLMDNDAGMAFILRKGRLYNSKKKLVSSVVGTMDIKKKMVTLTTPDGDVQVFRLGEEEKD